jgi:hypothetical protein
MSFKDGSMSFAQAVAAEEEPTKGSLTARDRNDMAAIGKKQQLKVRKYTRY